ncbi:MAG: rRNA maturation RNase YbeY [Anaerolineae bacterium]|nr:rRNA maturation RNase YbeY [Anaerolineae bacterium]
MNEKYHIEIHVEDTVDLLDVQPLDDAVRLTLMVQDVAQSCEVVVVITDDAALEDLNLRFRGTPGPTDVLSFANESRGPFSMGSAEFPPYLGDIVISMDRAREQAAAAGVALEAELQLLAVHGTLHLLGYDHADERQKERMWAIQSEILRMLGVSIPSPE